jgi:hypothetical protein
MMTGQTTGSGVGDIMAFVVVYVLVGWCCFLLCGNEEFGHAWKFVLLWPLLGVAWVINFLVSGGHI